jgi:hypothetical protein
MASREGIPVEVVGRPSIGEGRTPGCACMGFEEVGAVGDGASEPGRESAMLRFRNAIVCREKVNDWFRDLDNYRSYR